MVVSGSSGLIGAALVPALARAGHQVSRLVRRPVRPEQAEIWWDPAGGGIDAASLEGFDAVIHLAGERLMALRWTSAKRRRIHDSRVRGTELLARTLAERARPPQAFITASATGYYGDRGAEVLREESPPGEGFLAEVVQAWEAATAPAAVAGIRVVQLRIAPVVALTSPLLRPQLPLSRLGLGGWFGGGRRYWGWVALEDVVGAIVHCLAHSDLAGPVNVVAPQAVTSQQFAKTLGRVLGRPVLIPAPAPAARLLLGRLADEMLLASQRAEPARLLASGYRFLYPELEGALRHALGRA